MFSRFLRLAALTLFFPGLSLACACGCGIFDVGTSSMYASHAGGMAFVEYDCLDQRHNRSATSTAPAASSVDKAIRSGFMTVGGQYQFNRRWGLSAELPYWQRFFKTTDPDSGDIVSSKHGALGGIRIKGA